MNDEKFRDLQVETVLAYYAAARAELLERLNIRANIAVLYIGAIGAVAGYALSAPLERFYLASTVIPILAWGAALLWFQQDRAMDQLSKHCAEEICPYLVKLWEEGGEVGGRPPLSIDQNLFPQKGRRKGPIKELFDRVNYVAGMLFVLIPLLALIGISTERLTNLLPEWVIPTLLVVGWLFFFSINDKGDWETKIGRTNSAVNGS